MRPLYDLVVTLLSLTTIIWISVISVSAYGADTTSKQNNAQNLQQVQAQIHTIKQDLLTRQVSRDQLEKNVQQAEMNLGKLMQQGQQITIQLTKQQAILQTLNDQQTIQQQTLATQRIQLAQHIRASYALGGKDYMKMLLSQENPAVINRNLAYYRYFIQHRIKLIENIGMTLTQLAENKVATEVHTVELHTLQRQQKHQIEDIQVNQQQREQALEKMNSDIKSKHQRLQVLLTNKQALEKVVQKLKKQQLAAPPSAEVSSNLPPTTITQPFRQIPFAQAKGKLRWPTSGKIIAGFNTMIEDSELQLNGLLIAAPEGQNVTAAAPGQVVFAQWMPGYGLLLIIDHGQGYMTLYGRNGSLYRKVGDKISAGEVVSTVGKTGGYEQPSLYFAVRHQGEPVNPMGWFTNS